VDGSEERTAHTLVEHMLQRLRALDAVLLIGGVAMVAGALKP
jgi:hypothetical protein